MSFPAVATPGIPLQSTHPDFRIPEAWSREPLRCAVVTTRGHARAVTEVLTRAGIEVCGSGALLIIESGRATAEHLAVATAEQPMLIVGAPRTDLLERVAAAAHVDVAMDARNPLEIGLRARRLVRRRAMLSIRGVARLTRTESAILQELLRRGGAAVSVPELLAAVRAAGSRCRSANLIPVYVGYLRRKLRPVSRSWQIATVRGQGYALEASSGPELRP